MAQTLKESIRAKIVDAALSAFAEDGWALSSMADISRRAGVSVGNLYRYYSGKTELLEAAISAETAAELEALAARKISAMGGLPLDSKEGRETEARERAALVGGLMEKRRELAFLCGGAEGSPREGFPRRFADALVAEFRSYASAVGADAEKLASPLSSALLLSVYENLTLASRSIFREARDGAQMAAALDALIAYHVAGVQRLLDYFRN
jgi:AcrR family transcriptional regulator